MPAFQSAAEAGQFALNLSRGLTAQGRDRGRGRGGRGGRVRRRRGRGRGGAAFTPTPTNDNSSNNDNEGGVPIENPAGSEELPLRLGAPDGAEGNVGQDVNMK